MSYRLTKRQWGVTLFYPGEGEQILEEDFLPGNGTVLFSRTGVTLMKGQRVFLNAIAPSSIENSDTSAVFADMDELRTFFANTILPPGHFHSEIVAGTAGTSWTHFEPAPCIELLVQNNTTADIKWNKGETDRYLVIPAGQARTIGGITNAYQVQIMLSLTEGSPTPVTIYAEAMIR